MGTGFLGWLANCMYGSVLGSVVSGYHLSLTTKLFFLLSYIFGLVIGT